MVVVSGNFLLIVTRIDKEIETVIAIAIAIAIVIVIVIAIDITG